MYNERRQHDSIKLFEIAEVYTAESNVIKKYLGIIISGRVDNNHEDFSRKLDSKYIENILHPYVNMDLNLNIQLVSRDY